MLAKLMNSNQKGISESSISALVRGEERAKTLESKGCTPVLFEDLDSFDQIKSIASEFDGKINRKKEHTE